jgi:DNA repair exonuclease SbcCD ATPase subunit
VSADEDQLTEATEGLFALHPGEFVAARNELVKALRKAGDRELAARVGELRRPSPAAWAVNQLARHRREDLENLVGLGLALREAQEQALGGADAQLLRQAGRARRDAVATLADAAVDLLAECGSGADAHTREITATLEAASLDPGAGEASLAGRLTSALDPPSGFGDGDLPPAARPREPAPKAKPKAEATDTDVDDRRERLAKAERAVSEATELAAKKSDAAARAAAFVGELEARLGELETEVARLERELADARAAAEKVERDLDKARETAAQAADAAADAEQRITDAQARIEALRR